MVGGRGLAWVVWQHRWSNYGDSIQLRAAHEDDINKLVAVGTLSYHLLKPGQGQEERGQRKGVLVTCQVHRCLGVLARQEVWRLSPRQEVP